MSVSPKSRVGGSLFRFGLPPSRQNTGGSVASTTTKLECLAVKSPRRSLSKEEVQEVKPKKTIKKATKKVKKVKTAPSTSIKTIGLLYNKAGKWFVPPKAQFTFNALDEDMKTKIEEKIVKLEETAKEEEFETHRFENTGESKIVPSIIGGIARGFVQIPN